MTLAHAIKKKFAYIESIRWHFRSVIEFALFNSYITMNRVENVAFGMILIYKKTYKDMSLFALQILKFLKELTMLNRSKKRLMYIW